MKPRLIVSGVYHHPVLIEGQKEHKKSKMMKKNEDKKKKTISAICSVFN
jgi:hypothetical protein